MMMKDRLPYLLIIVVLSVAFAGQYYWLQHMPTPDRSLIRHEASHYRMVNLFEKNSFYTTFGNLEDHARHSIKPKTKSTYEAAIRIKQSLSEVLTLLWQTRGYRGDDGLLKKAVALHDRELALVRPHTEREYEFVTPEDGALDEDVFLFDLCRRESQFLENYVRAMDLYYDACCDGVYDRFYDARLLLSPIGYKHFPDTLEVFMPLTIKSGVKERIEITANKKYFDKMIDSLQNAGVLNWDSRPFYKGVVRLKSDDLAIEKLNSDRQVISELDHTTWRFDVSAEEKGVKRVGGEVGVIVLDSNDKEEIFYVPLRLGVVEVL